MASLHRRSIKVWHKDGFQGLIGLLPPTSRRAVILIDPSYEVKADYQQLTHELKRALKRFATGTYMIWYPCLQREESIGLPNALRTCQPTNYLNVELHVAKPRTDGFGMHGSGLFIINPPYTLVEELKTVLPELCQLLAQDQEAHYVLDAQID